MGIASYFAHKKKSSGTIGQGGPKETVFRRFTCCRNRLQWKEIGSTQLVRGPWHLSCSLCWSTRRMVPKASSPIVDLSREDIRLTPAERRRSPRIHLQIPMFVRGVDASGADFLDLAKTLDISANGAFLVSPRMLKTDYVVHLTIPAPPPSSSGMVPPETPPILARVRRQQAAGDAHLVGVEFLKTLD